MKKSKVKYLEHKVVGRYKEYWSGDCYLYRIICSCGEECGGWTPEDAETSFKDHFGEQTNQDKSSVEEV